MTLLRLQKSITQDGTPLVIVASNEVAWPDGLEDLLQQAFELTMAEVDVVRSLVECKRVADIAEERGRSVDTIRTQIKSILSKTETNSQTELLRLVLSIMDITKTTQDGAPKARLVSAGAGLEPRDFHSFITRDGRRSDYLVLGDPKGKPILFLPLDYGLVRWPAPAERAAAQQGLRIIVPVRAGYGKSDPVKRKDYDAMVVSDALEVLEKERVQSCPVITLGSDSYYATLLANMAPGKITAILACAGVLPMTRPEQYDRMEKWHRFILAGGKYTPALLPFMVKAGFLLARKIGKRGFIHAVYGQCPADVNTFENTDVFEAMVTGSEVALSSDHTAHDAFSSQILGGQLTDWSEQIDALKSKLPVIFMNGAQDPQVPLETLQEFQADFDWIDYHVHQDAGQLIFFRHWEKVLNLITPYVNKPRLIQAGL